MNKTKTYIAYIYVTYRPDTKEFYIGSRTIKNKTPSDDFRYFGSGTWVKDMYKYGIYIKKEVLAVFSEKEKARVYEFRAINHFSKHPLNRNIHLGVNVGR